MTCISRDALLSPLVSQCAHQGNVNDNETMVSTTKCSRLHGLPYEVHTLLLIPGASILINISGIHRNPQHYSQPDHFVPERFSPEESLKRPRNCFVPFGNGPRKCIGQKFALIHLKLAFSVLLRRFELLPSERYERIEDCVTAFRFVIEFKRGCFVKFEPRGTLEERRE